MPTIPSGTRFLGTDSSLATTEKRSGKFNDLSEHYTIEDITSAVPSQVSVTAVGTTIATTVVLSYNISLITGDASNTAVRLPEPLLGGVVGVVNNSAVDISVFPFDSADTITGLSAGEAYIVPADGLLYNITCTKNPFVGNWSVSTPFNGVSAVITYKLDMTVDSSSTATGDTRTASGQYSGIAASVDQVSASGQVVYRELILSSSNANMAIMDMSKFASFSQFRLKTLSIKTNIPAGPLNVAGTTPNSGSLMGINAAQFNSLKVNISSQVYDYTISPSIQMYSIGDLDKAFLQLYSTYYYSYVSGDPTLNPALPSNGGLTHYVAVPGDAAYDSSNPGTRYQKYNVSNPSATGFTQNGASLGGDWKPIYDLFGNPARYIGFNSVYGNASAPSSAFPSGFEFKSTIEIDWEVK
tara:strand:+ start:1538 stop:2773 length:1236 start_codon:yes stop_codon:yes gene_type:complete